MANYYSDHPEIGFYLNHPLMARIVELKEKGFTDEKEYDYAPVDLGDAIENYKQILDITGDVAANIIAPNSEDVDLEGPHLENGRMIYASKTFENLDATRKAGLWGVSMPRRYGGLNLPNAVFSMLSEVISAADAGFADRVDFSMGNVLEESTKLPANPDAVWMSQFLDCFSLHQVTKILKKVCSA